jgi:hypothetical protein
MAIKSYVVVEIVKNDHTYEFRMPVGVPYGEAYDAAYEALNTIVELAKNAAESAKPQDKEQAEAVTAELAN